MIQQLLSFQKNDKKDSIATGNTRGRVQLAGHKGWEPEDGFDDVKVEVPGVPFVCAVAPVVLALVGAEELTARLATKTFKALNSCPRPVVPSYSLFVQRVPQVVPLSPPEHCLAAPRAELRR